MAPFEDPVHPRRRPCCGRDRDRLRPRRGDGGVQGSRLSAPLSLRLLALYPKKLGSEGVGALARMALPAPLRKGVLSRFAAAVGADCSEAEKPLGEYASLLDFFTRRLKPGLRPQAPPVAGGINSPVDGDLIASGRIEDGTLIQAKGLPYRLDELLGGDPLAGLFASGHFATLYLSPKDYHRIHVPCEGLCRSVARIEGELWPVNAASTAHTPRLYVRNRRSTWIAEGTGSDEGLWIGAVLVAATHVGGAVIDGRWLGGRTLPAHGRLDVNGLQTWPGDDLGTFELGSTVVLLIGGEKASCWALTRGHGLVRVGERLGAIACAIS